MTTRLSNNAETGIAAAVTAAATTIQVTPGTGSLFPDLDVGEWFSLFLIKLPVVTAAGVVTTPGRFEIVRVNAVNNDTLTVERQQEGTVAQTFDPLDRVSLRITAAMWAALAQSGGENFTAVRGMNFGSAAGTVNAIEVDVAEINAYTSHTYARVKPIGANSGPITLNINGLGATAVTLGNGDALYAGAIATEQVAEFRFDIGSGNFIIQNPEPRTASGASSTAVGLAQRGIETNFDVNGDNEKFTTQQTVSNIIQNFADTVLQELQAIPFYWRHLGNAAGGNFTVLAGQNISFRSGFEHQYNDFTINENGSLIMTDAGVGVIRCQGKFTLGGDVAMARSGRIAQDHIGPNGANKSSGSNQNIPYKSSRPWERSIDDAVNGMPLELREFVNGVLGGWPLHSFHGGHGDADNDVQTPQPGGGGFIVIANEVELLATARVRNMHSEPVNNFLGPAGGGMLVFGAETFTDNDATFEAGDAGIFKTAAGWLADLNAGSPANANAANGHMFSINLLTGSFTREF